MTNPFQVPDTQPGSREPLCPWRAPTHRAYYVDVDSTGTAYATFVEQLQPFSDLTRQGRLVVVRGESGCGKTSLIHRCADLLDEALNRPPAGTSAPGDFIVDLTTYPYRLEQSQPRRLVEVCISILEYLRDRNRIAVPDELLEPLHRASDEIAGHIVSDTYRELARRANELGFLLIILLPPAKDHINDLHEYSYQASNRERLVFFTESSLVTMIDDFLETELLAGRPTVGLTVNPVSVADGFKLADSRIGDDAGVATVSRETMDRAMKAISKWGPPSVRTVQTALYRAWSRYENHPGPVEVTDFEILTSMMEQFHPLSRANGGGAA